MDTLRPPISLKSAIEQDLMPGCELMDTGAIKIRDVNLSHQILMQKASPDAVYNRAAHATWLQKNIGAILVGKESILNMDTNEHDEIKRVMYQNGFGRPKNVNEAYLKQVSVFEVIVDQYVEVVEQSLEGGTEVDLNLYEITKRMTMDAALHSFFGQSFTEQSSEEIRQITDNLLRLEEEIFTAISPFKFENLQGAISDFKELLKEGRELGDRSLELIQNKKAHMLQKANEMGIEAKSFGKLRSIILEKNLTSTFADDVLSALLVTPRKEKDMLGRPKFFKDNVILSQVTTLFVAGHITTASSMSWGIHDILQYQQENPRFVNRWFNEIDRLKSGKISNHEELLATYASVYEVLRRRPVVPEVWRQMSEDVIIEVDGQQVQIPKKQVFNIYIYDLAKNEEKYPNPNTFDPLRFLKDVDTTTPTLDKELFNYAKIFAEGHHKCLGENFATLELGVMIPMFFQKLAEKGITMESLNPKLQEHIGLIVQPEANVNNVKFSRRTK